MRLSVIIPVYNEEQTIQEVLERVAAVPLGLGGIAMEIVIANDGSTDGTRRAIDERRLPSDLPVQLAKGPLTKLAHQFADRREAVLAGDRHQPRFNQIVLVCIKRNGRVLAIASIYRDAESLKEEAAMEVEAKHR